MDQYRVVILEGVTSRSVVEKLSGEHINRAHEEDSVAGGEPGEGRVKCHN